MQPGCGCLGRANPTEAASQVIADVGLGNRPLEAAFAGICAGAKRPGLILANHESPLFAYVPQCSRKQLPNPLSEKA